VETDSRPGLEADHGEPDPSPGTPVDALEDSRRFIEMHERLSRALTAECVRGRVRKQDQEDVVSEGICKFLDGHGRTGAGFDWNDLSKWAHKTVDRELSQRTQQDKAAADHLAREGKLASQSDAWSDPHAIVEAEETKARILALIRRLPEKQQACFWMAKKGLTPDQVAEILDIEVTTVYAYGTRLRDAVRAMLGDDYPTVVGLRARNPNSRRTNR
jgi:RNA polymerase sigma factor (sigma-70 family)